MVNEKGAEKRYPDKEWNHTSFFIPEHWKATWKALCQFAEKDNDEEFKAYCEAVEGQNVKEKKQGRRGLYIRWILSKHVDDKQQELAGDSS